MDGYSEELDNPCEITIDKDGIYTYTFKGVNEVGESEEVAYTFDIDDLGWKIGDENKTATFDFTSLDNLESDKPFVPDEEENSAIHVVDHTFTNNNVTLSFNKSGSTTTRIWNKKDLRIYGGGDFVIKSDDIITKITINGDKGTIKYNGQIVGTISKNNPISWNTPEDMDISAVTFDVSSSATIYSISVETYIPATVIDPTFTFNGEELESMKPVDVKEGDVISISTHRHAQIQFQHPGIEVANAPMRIQAAGDEWYTVDEDENGAQNVYNYVVPASLPEEGLTIKARSYKNHATLGELASEPVQFMLKADGTVTGIEAVAAEASAVVEYFNLQGVRVENPAKGGLYIRRQGAEVSKVIF